MKKYKLEELQLGMEVAPEQLSEIYDTFILVIKQHMEDNTGIIQFIGKEQNEEYRRVYHCGKVIAPVYNDSMELEEDVYFDE